MSTTNTNNLETSGGWLNIQIASLEELKTCPNIITNENANTIVIQGNETTVNILPIPERFTITVTPRKNKNGTTYSINISLDIPTQSKNLDDYLNAFKNKKVVVLAEDANNNLKMFGSKNHPLDFSYQEINGRKREDISMTKIKVSGNVGQKPVYISF